MVRAASLYPVIYHDTQLAELDERKMLIGQEVNA